jgi:hypothetical protein
VRDPSCPQGAITDNPGIVIDNYAQALDFLDADGSVDDEQIQALFAVKVRVVAPHPFPISTTHSFRYPTINHSENKRFKPSA